MTTINVELEGGPSRSYPIVIERGSLDSVGKAVAGLGLGPRCAVVTNPFVGGLYGERVRDSLVAAGFEPFTIELGDGEEFKTMAEASRIYDRLIEERMERSGVVVALGGGVVGDMAGFVAATYLRGVPYVQVPTTLLAQVDSSVGGKTAVNHPKGKNLVGAFYQPKAVLIDPEVLKTLEKRELSAGLAEVVKYGVIWEGGLFNYLLDECDEILALKGPMDRVIERSCGVKARVVSADEKEEGLRSILNFGHTFGHAIEAVTGYTRFKHGEAVAIGMVMAAALSERLGRCEAGVKERIIDLLERFSLPTGVTGLNGDEFLRALYHDKKVSGGRLRFVLATGVGEVVTEEVGRSEVEALLKEGGF